MEWESIIELIVEGLGVLIGLALLAAIFWELRQIRQSLFYWHQQQQEDEKPSLELVNLYGEEDSELHIVLKNKGHRMVWLGVANHDSAIDHIELQPKSIHYRSILESAAELELLVKLNTNRFRLPTDYLLNIEVQFEDENGRAYCQEMTFTGDGASFLRNISPPQVLRRPESKIDG